MMTEETKRGLPTAADPDQVSRVQNDAVPRGSEGGVEAKRTAQVDVQAYIGRQLRAVYDDVAKQPVPDRFLDLMKKLEGVRPGDQGGKARD